MYTCYMLAIEQNKILAKSFVFRLNCWLFSRAIVLPYLLLFVTTWSKLIKYRYGCIGLGYITYPSLEKKPNIFGSPAHSLTPSLTHKRLAISSIYPLFVDRFGRSLRLYNLEFDKEAISDGLYGTLPYF